MATNNALSNFMEEAFLKEFVTPSVAGTIYVAVPFTGQLAAVDADIGAHSIENGLVVGSGKFIHIANDANSLETADDGVAKSLANYNSSANILVSGRVAAGCFRIVPIFFSFLKDSTSTIQNTYQLDFGVLGDSTDGAGTGVSLTGYYVYAGEIRNSSGTLVDINSSELTSEATRTLITDCSSDTGYTITVDLTKPAFYGTLSKVQAINTGIDILIKKNDIKFSME